MPTARQATGPAAAQTVVAVLMQSVSQPDELARRREQRAWLRAVEYLNERGMAACVPCSLVDILRRRGLAVWCQERVA